jgi:hypothetical protein
VKKGRKPLYIMVEGKPVKSILHGVEVGLSCDKSTGTYYMMLPHLNPHKKYEKNFFGKDKDKAVKAFWKFIEAVNKMEVEKQKEKELKEKKFWGER